MDFDRYTVVLLVTPEHPPELSEEEADRLQDAHLAHLAHLPDEALRLKGEDPAVQAGVFDLVAMPWMLPAGAIAAGDATFPRSADDV